MKFDFDDGSMDNCGLVLVFFILVLVDCEDIGFFEDIYMVIDVFGNSVFCISIVIVIDEIDFSLICFGD